MLKLIASVFKILTPKQKKKLLFFQLLIIVVSFTELVGVVSIGPFMALIGDSNIVYENDVLKRLYDLSGADGLGEFIFIMGFMSFSILLISTLISIYATWKLNLISRGIGIDMSNSLFDYYLHKPWLYHASSNSSDLITKLSYEANRVSNNIIRPLLTVNAKLILSLVLSSAVFMLNPTVAVVAIAVFFSIYFILFVVIKKLLVVNSGIVSRSVNQRFRLMNDGFGGIKDTLLLDKQNNLTDQYVSSGKDYCKSEAIVNTLSTGSIYFIEMISFGAIISLVLYLTQSHDGDLGKTLPLLSIYALAAFKLIPAFQNIFASLTQIKGNQNAFFELEDDLKGLYVLEMESENISHESAEFSPLQVDVDIELRGVSFKYPEKKVNAISNLTMHIPVNAVIGIAGSSGSGKSTLMDILLGLIEPDQGGIYADSQMISGHNIKTWKRAISFVPQHIYLSPSSIVENVAFGVKADEINVELVNEAIERARLSELISELPDGVNTLVGERGVKLSGGQRQRIGIARALYHQANILVFDEATSALDGITEKYIMDAIHDFSGAKTILMVAHRLSTLEKCDVIYFMDKGSIVDQGSYDDLYERNEEFRSMALKA